MLPTTTTATLSSPPSSTSSTSSIVTTMMSPTRSSVSHDNSMNTTVASHSPYPRTGKRGVPQQFPRKLYEMLNEETKILEGQESSINLSLTSNYQVVISWSASGKAFRINNTSEFASTTLPKYFRTKKFSSFQRNLNLYGFAKVRRGADSDMYAHPSFMRDRPDLLVELRKVGNTMSTPPLSPLQTRESHHESREIAIVSTSDNDDDDGDNDSSAKLRITIVPTKVEEELNVPAQLKTKTAVIKELSQSSSMSTRSVSPSHSNCAVPESMSPLMSPLRNTSTGNSKEIVFVDSNKSSPRPTERPGVPNKPNITLGNIHYDNSRWQSKAQFLQRSGLVHRTLPIHFTRIPCDYHLIKKTPPMLSKPSVVSKTSDRGKLDLLALVMEYECLRASPH